MDAYTQVFASYSPWVLLWGFMGAMMLLWTVVAFVAALLPRRLPTVLFWPIPLAFVLVTGLSGGLLWFDIQPSLEDMYRAFLVAWYGRLLGGLYFIGLAGLLALSGAVRSHLRRQRFDRRDALLPITAGLVAVGIVGPLSMWANPTSGVWVGPVALLLLCLPVTAMTVYSPPRDRAAGAWDGELRMAAVVAAICGTLLVASAGLTAIRMDAWETTQGWVRMGEVPTYGFHDLVGISAGGAWAAISLQVTVACALVWRLGTREYIVLDEQASVSSLVLVAGVGLALCVHGVAGLGWDRAEIGELQAQEVQSVPVMTGHRGVEVPVRKTLN